MNTILELIKQEEKRQQSTINLIASENYVSANVLAATGSVLTNKYAEGYPSKRYYSGCEVIDVIEQRAIQACQELFEAEHCNVQPHAGSQANMAVYFTALKPGDTILAMSLGSGGHLTHGHPVNFSGKLFNFVHYTVSPENDLLDYDEIEILAHQHQPKMIVAGASAYSRIIDFKRFATIAHNNKAFLFVDMAHIAGLVAAGVHPSPVPLADFVSSTTHKTLRGPRGGLVLCKADFANKLDKAIMPGMQGGPLMHVIAAKAIAFEEALTPAFKAYQHQIVANAHAMCAAFKELGYYIVSGGTDNHLFLINLKKSSPKGIPSTQGLTGVLIEKLVERCNITLNRNAIPGDTESPMITSGVRIGTPAITTRGFKEQDCVNVAHLIHEIIKKRDHEQSLKRLGEEIKQMCQKFPLSTA